MAYLGMVVVRTSQNVGKIGFLPSEVVKEENLSSTRATEKFRLS